MSAQAAEFVRDWRKANCRAWLMKLERILNRMLKSPRALFSRRLEARRTEQGTAFASLLAAAALDGLFDHPAGCFLVPSLIS